MNKKLILTSIAALISVNAYSKDISKQDVVTHYADLALANYSEALITAKTLNTAIDAFIKSPSQSTQNQAKSAWLDARVAYQQSEVFRFGNAIVDDWEGQLNAWPLDEGLIDYVDHSSYEFELGNDGAQANIIASPNISIGADSFDSSLITKDILISLNEVAGSGANVTTGYHAIEFLLWGQDLNGTNPGAGERSYTDYLTGDQCTNNNCKRRGEYLDTVSDLLVSDLAYMVNQWSENQSNYRSELLSEDSNTVLRKMLFGMGSLSLGELAGERMKVALEANSTEDEHDCFSDNTHNSHYYNAQGIKNILLGTYKKLNGDLVIGASLLDLVKQKDDKLAAQAQNTFNATTAALQALVDSAEKNNVHFDQLIAQGNKEGHAIVNNAINALVAQTAIIEKIATLLEIDQLDPDTADHEF
ncbi:imelysin family protein [Marinicellulosiphila megalodicopiae]|uniref:imelysin family protein n=1 Tax=Marinicellulosiphila megalodicopiae TaxID=2724896 RepID=UPI003BB12F80